MHIKMKIKKHLSLAPLIAGFKASLVDYKDNRLENSTNYTALDTALSGLSCMFYKSGSMVNFQERMEKQHHKNNFQTHFGVTNTPKDNQMRSIIGAIPSSQFAPVFEN